jgi:preprotein translocase subunit SecY
MLITVGVLLDTMRQIETYLLQRHYDGFLRKGKMRGRSAARTKQIVDTAGLQDFWTVWRPLLFIAIALFVLGIVSWFLNLG